MSNTTEASDFFDVTSGLAPLCVKSGWIIVLGANHATAQFVFAVPTTRVSRRTAS